MVAYLELLKGETATHAGLEVVALGGRANDGAQRARGGAGEDGLGLLLAGCTKGVR